VFNSSIDLQERVQPPIIPIYSSLQNELLALKDYIEGNLTKIIFNIANL